MDLNKLLAGIQKDSKDLDVKMKEILAKYDELYRLGNRQYVEEREASASMVGLEDFYVLVQTIRRNRDVMGSLLRGIGSLRDLSKYKFVEEEEKPAEKRPRRGRQGRAPVPEPVPVMPPELTGGHSDVDSGESVLSTDGHELNIP